MNELHRAMAQMGNLNYLAEEEYAAARDRLEFHQKQEADLRQAREDLLEAIRRINETAGAMFEETFNTVQTHFLGTFDRLFPGGEASLTLQGGDPLEGDIEIAARPRGKRLESIRLLSSGERALTAIALLFALYLAKPSPVCLLDEVDAPLDDANLDRFLSLVRHFSEKTQFICITHNKKTMEMADRLFGVTMEEPGISKIVSVHLDGGSAEILDQLAAGPGAIGAGGGAGGSA
jgi:chromosome segregation protein